MTEVTVIASKTCSHYPLLEQELHACGVGYEAKFVEDEPELVGRYGLYQSPNLMVGDEVVFRGRANHPLPSPAELGRILEVFGVLHESRSNRSRSMRAKHPGGQR